MAYESNTKHPNIKCSTGLLVAKNCDEKDETDMNRTIDRGRPKRTHYIKQFGDILKNS